MGPSRVCVSGQIQYHMRDWPGIEAGAKPIDWTVLGHQNFFAEWGCHSRWAVSSHRRRPSLIGTTCWKRAQDNERARKAEKADFYDENGLRRFEALYELSGPISSRTAVLEGEADENR